MQRNLKGIQMTDRTKQPQHGGVGIISLIVVVFILVIAVLLFVDPGRPHMPRLALSAACKANLSGIGKSLASYEESHGSLPLIKPYEAIPNGANSAPTEANQTDYRLGDTSAPEDEMTWECLGDQAMQNVWLLVTARNVNERIFLCPADRLSERRGDDAAKYGWTDPRQYSYGMQWPYQTDAAGNANPAPFGAPNTIMLADRNPGGPVGEVRPPSNHSKYGTNCLLWDGSVVFSRREGFPRRTVSTLGFEGDEIYANAAGEAGGLPQSATDTSITLSGR